jgi:N-acetylglucosaminyldiphosphoundecaprenol N-acetyl-beta-D-mannosaminyltransferase
MPVSAAHCYASNPGGPPQPTYDVLGVPVAAVQMADVVGQMEHWICSGGSTRYVCAANVHTVIEAQHDARFLEVLKSAAMVVADGAPLLWLGRQRGHELKRRVYGPELMLSFCELAAKRGYRQYLYGGGDGVAHGLAGVLEKRFPGLIVSGSYAPAFRTISSPPDLHAIDAINRAQPDVLWVGLGCPKQEWWMYQHRDLLQVPVMVGVGAAFDFFTGRVRQAPAWMRDHGLEWLFRFSQEPRRLWKRYLIYNAQFLAAVGRQALVGSELQRSRK